MRVGTFVISALAMLGSATAADEAGPEARISLEVTPLEATVGDRLSARLVIELPPETRLEPVELGPELGPFSVISGGWEPGATPGNELHWIWSGELVAFRTGELELPAIEVRLDGPEGSSSVSTDPQKVVIRSVLEDDEDEEQAGLKGAVALAPDYRVLWLSLGILGLLLLGSLLFWWLHRRYGARLAAAEVAHDPFHRTPPHEWVYAELQRVLELRLPEQGRVNEFYSELSRILKTYLAGRYRVALLERTSAELTGLLGEVGAERQPARDAETVLASCDQVKFAKARPGADDWKSAVESIYRVVDATKPVEARPSAEGVSA